MENNILFLKDNKPSKKCPLDEADPVLWGIFVNGELYKEIICGREEAKTKMRQIWDDQNGRPTSLCAFATGKVRTPINTQDL